MTDEQINIAIAEALGASIDDSRVYLTIDGDICGFYLFTADLNACHEFEKVLTDSQRLNYQVMLGGYPSDYDYWRLCHATARQRCEAYLRTLNLFVD